MKDLGYLVLLVAATVTTAAPLTSSPQDTSPSLNHLEARRKKKYCWDGGIACYYENGQCFWHECTWCTCQPQIEDIIGGNLAVNRERRDCQHSDDRDLGCQIVVYD
ncbi:hypothetical protein Ptr902_12228 [Pyrenophora tritici-repentis]|uniref:Uncharacterized protein n=1 Tax=Pyrenophora tritici-repentis TaxID=45151 RepID=A0A5M9KPI3_9PLEO|nr:hypothetical protein PtrV1_13365 [Pyrenophora tritici-repentis]KAF7446684.1 hypothetical protein A1F99_081310 [Pyrenophora tritici-repentis]KAF7568954.1 hypothetical protein PtrM4_113690 [Pyrenophora tritici-repentis]KAI0577326.1 hypothetical protein Alg215_06971 [Pyrenophora tritici-repentis]KAI0581407.1 hypothetical protein Alg130_06594 [Pyrenophora tritici-repentis]